MTTFLPRLCRPIHMGRIVPKIDPIVASKVGDNSVRAKELASRRNYGFTKLPALLEVAAENRLKNIDSKFRKEAQELLSIMYNLKLPDDSHAIKMKKADIKTELELRDKIKNRPDYDPTEFQLKEDIDIAKYELSQLINGTLEDRRRDWHYYEYDEYAANLYMATRLPPNYACVKTVMNEIKASDPSFEPKSVLDFGSGMGTVTWAVNETWPEAVNEFMNIELSKEQQYLCEYLLRGGREFGELPGIFHRQYLPSSNKVRYDMVVAAFSLLELPNAELRAHTIENLWHKTNDLLVLIERGNKGGFTTINEARHLILDITGHKVTDKVKFSCESQPNLALNTPNSHVLAPCPHEFLCPKIAMPDKRKLNVCRYRTVHEPLEFGGRKSGPIKEEFSYVVLRKKPHFINSIRWPRLVEGRKRGGGRVTHKLCCPSGNLAETTITKAKYGKPLFEVAKSCDWGDLLPISIKD